MADHVRIVLPKKYDLVVGDTFQLFYRGVIEAPNPYVYSIVACCQKGKNYPRYFEYTPEEEGQHFLSIALYDAQRNQVGYAETMLNVVAAKEPKKTVNVLCIGDSLTGGGGWVQEVCRRITASDGTPCGLGFANAANFVGSVKPKNKTVRLEGYGGWHWQSFLTNTAGAMWIECKNDRGTEDQHSVWQDVNGALWELETLQVDYLKFNRYAEHTSPRPEHGPLIHVKYAADTSPIEFDHSSTAGGTPFFDKEKGCIDFTTYAQRNDIESIDAVYCFLGTNGLMTSAAVHSTREEYCQLVVATAKQLIDKIKEAFPNVAVKIMGLPNSAPRFGKGCDLPLNDYMDIVHYKKELDLAYQAWCLEDGYKDFMEFINLSGQVDSEYVYPCKEKPVNTRSEVTERVDTNGAHFASAGYMQIADAVFRNFVCSFCKE